MREYREYRAAANINQQQVFEKYLSSKKRWSLVRQVQKNSAFCDINSPLEHDNIIITDNKEKACLFNTFFLKASDLDESDADLPDNLRILNENNLSTIEITESDVLDQLVNLDVSKAYGFDQIPPKLLKEGRVQICSTLCNYLTCHFIKSVFPCCGKKRI